MLLYYTGVTRVARNILVEIVEGMFLNQRDKLAILRDMKDHAGFCADAIQHGSYVDFASAVARSWRLNKLLDPDTTNPEIERLVGLIEPYAAGFKLAGAGGGGYMYILAKDPDAAVRIRAVLQGNPLNARSRFVGMNFSGNGLQVTRS
jgi:galactokinase/mevalonate kinase-like predicted kinase